MSGYDPAAEGAEMSFDGRMAYGDYKLERFLTLNSLTADSRLAPGSKVKLVVYGNR